MMPRWQRIGLKVLYWAAVLALSLALLVALILLIESRDQSSVGSGASRRTRRRSASGLGHQPGEDDDPVRRAVERVARAQDEARPARNAPRDPDRIRADDLCLLDRIGEPAVRHLEDDPLAGLELVD